MAENPNDWEIATRLVRGRLTPARPTARWPRRSISPRASPITRKRREPPTLASAGAEPGFIYARYGNPTVAMFEQRLALLEEGRGVPGHRLGHGGGASGAHRPRPRQRPHRRRQGSARLVPLDPQRMGAAVRGRDHICRCARYRRLARRDAAQHPRRVYRVPGQSLAGAHRHRRRRRRGPRGQGRRIIVDNVFATADRLPIAPETQGRHRGRIRRSYIDGQGEGPGQGDPFGKPPASRGDLQGSMRHFSPALSPFNAWLLLKGQTHGSSCTPPERDGCHPGR